MRASTYLHIQQILSKISKHLLENHNKELKDAEMLLRAEEFIVHSSLWATAFTYVVV